MRSESTIILVCTLYLMYVFFIWEHKPAKDSPPTKSKSTSLDQEPLDCQLDIGDDQQEKHEDRKSKKEEEEGEEEDDFFKAFAISDEEYRKMRKHRNVSHTVENDENKPKQKQKKPPPKKKKPDNAKINGQDLGDRDHQEDSPASNKTAKIILSPDNLCTVPDLLLLVYVHTEADNYKRRALIRQTWGKPSFYSKYNIRVLFVMGKVVKVPMMQMAVEHEAKTHKDIIQGDFDDVFSQQSCKGLTALRWISQHCGHAKYVLKAEDREFINMYTLLHHLAALYKEGFRKELLLCMVIAKRIVKGDGPYAISTSAFEAKFFPSFCAPTSYIMSNDLPGMLVDRSSHVPYIPVEEIYITGVVVKSMSLTHMRFDNAYIGLYEMEELFSHPTEWSKYAFVHVPDNNADMFIKMWSKLTDMAKSHEINAPKKVVPGKLANEMIPKANIVKNPNTSYNKKKEPPKG